jgi:hypothetical protein
MANATEDPTMRRSRFLIIPLLAIGLAIGGIALASGDGDEERADTVAADGADTMGFDDPAPFVGMPKNEAIARAESEGRPWRIGLEDGEAFALTADLWPGRVTFEVEDGVVTAAEIEVENTDPPADGPPVIEDEAQARLVADAVKRLVTDDNSFGGASVFDEILIGRFIAGDPDRPLQWLDLEMAAAALDGVARVTFVDDTAAEIEARFDAAPTRTAVVTISDLVLLDDRAEIGMELWCGPLCGVYLTYGAEPAAEGWTITGPIGPIAMS